MASSDQNPDRAGHTMAEYDDYDDEDGEAGPAPDDDMDGLLGEAGPDAADDSGGGSFGISRSTIRDWLNSRRGWILIFGLAIAQGLFATIMIFLRSEARPVDEEQYRRIQDLAVEMLGHEVKIGQVYQLLPMRGGKRMTVGMDIVLVLGQLPEERIEGAERPNAQEFEMFVGAIRDLEPEIRSRVNIVLQKIPPEEYGSVEVYKTIKDEIRDFVNDTLDGVDFGKGLRQGIGKRRVTDVLLPMFVRQAF